MLGNFAADQLFAPESVGVQNAPEKVSNNFMGFSIRWPPAILSAHLGNLSLFSWKGLLVALLEIGPAILFLPWLTKRILPTQNQSSWWDKALLFSAWFGLIIPIFIIYRSERDITRLTSFAVSITVYLMMVYLIGEREKLKPITYNLGIISIGLMMFSGLVLAGTQLTAAPNTIFAHKYQDFDAKLLSQVWGKFPSDSKIYGSVGRGSILTGQLTGGIFSFPSGDERVIWEQLETEPSLDAFLSNDFEFVYFDDDFNKKFITEANNSDCVSVFASAQDLSGKHFTGFFDLRNCYP